MMSNGIIIRVRGSVHLPLEQVVLTGESFLILVLVSRSLLRNAFRAR